MIGRQSLTFAIIGAIACVVGALLFEVLVPARASSTPSSTVALLIDTSGSMRSDEKIQEVQRAASLYVSAQANAPSTAGVSVVRFSGDAQTLSALSRDWATHLGAISSLNAEGGTNIARGLEVASDALEGTPTGVARTILLFTDGQPDNAERALEVAARLRAGGVRLVAVGTGDADTDFLTEVTGDSRLVFRAATGGFADAFRRADTAIKQLFSGASSGRGLLEALILGALVTMALGGALLVAENVLGLRGRPWRDLIWVAPLSALLGVGGALLGQGLFLLLPDTAPSRAVAWALVGAVAGAVLGLAERSPVKAVRGALGGAAGGYVGGFVFAVLGGALSLGWLELIGRVLGFAVLGFAIGLMVQLVQQALKRAWITGLTTGPYEGKQYILAKPVVSVGRSDGNDIGLYKEQTLALKLGAFRFADGRWRYAGEPAQINGQLRPEAVLASGDTIVLGQTSFVFEERGSSQASTPEPSVAPLQPPPIPSSLTPPNPVSSPAATGARRWRLFGETLTELPRGRVTVGRLPENTLRIPDPSVSGYHALLEVADDALFVTDLGSTNGTLLNGARLEQGVPTPLNEGDQLAFGAMQYRVMG